MNFLSRLTRHFLLTLSLAGLAACGGGDDEDIYFQTIAQGTTQVTATRTVVVRDEAAWKTLWAEHAPSAPVPRVNFSEKTVLAVFNGTGGSACSTLAITRVLQKEQSVEVRYSALGPSAPDAVCAAVITYSAHLVMIGATNQPVTFVRQ